MIGQYTEAELFAMIEAAGESRSNLKYINGWACIRYGTSTYNYYRKCSDGSWLNYDCKTVYQP